MPFATTRKAADGQTNNGTKPLLAIRSNDPR